MQLLNNLTPAQFLAEYWQKKPLLIRQAIPNFSGLLTPNELAGLACEDDVQARIIQQKKEEWKVKHGPFDDKDFAKLPAKDWTLLVQNVNHYLPEAADLLGLFNFIPHARLDDLMVSYAPKNGGVGAHVDSYDVFLLQGSGKRKWQISAQKDLSLIENAPLKILKNFKAEQEWVLEAGDMLYLPPQIAHWGISESDDCMTYSIGFRAPKKQELAHEFLSYLQDNLAQNVSLTGLYEDPDLTLQKHPGEISDALQANIHAVLGGISWNKAIIADFLGHFLTEPKVHIVFEKNKKITLTVFGQKIANNGIALALKSQMLFYDDTFFMNGEAVKLVGETANILKKLADNRCLEASKIQDAPLLQQLYDWYLAGYLHFDA